MMKWSKRSKSNNAISKKTRREDYLDSLSEGKDLDDYGSKVDALVDSMSVTDEEVSTKHRRRDLDTL